RMDNLSCAIDSHPLRAKGTHDIGGYPDLHADVRSSPEGWPACRGIPGRHGAESVAGMRRNQWPASGGIRSLADEQQWPAVLEPVERVDFLDLCFADGTAGSEVEVLEARSQGKARGFDAIAGFTCLAIVGFSLQQRIEQLCVT